MNYGETLDYLFSQLPMFARIGKAAYKADLDNIKALCNAIGNPEKGLRCIHIAGTNGKGSSSHFIASVLQEAGYKTGLFTSPHLKDFRERIKINGKMISRNAIVKFTNENRRLFETLKPSFFEMTVALAFDHFRKKNIDIAVIETGLGGRLDSTNVINPEISLITNISKDHMELLGDTLEKIAFEKAGIIKYTTSVIIGERNPETDPVFLNKARLENSDILFAEDLVNWTKISSTFKNIHPQLHLNGSYNQPGKESNKIAISTPLTGNYQQKNLKGVVCTIAKLKELGWKIPKIALDQGVKNVVKNTGLRGRWEILGDHPLIVCDTAHNEAGVQEVMLQINSIKFKRLHIIWGMVGDKDINTILKLLPANASYYFCKPSIPRGLDQNILSAKAFEAGLNGKSYESVKKAVKAARKEATESDLIYIGGSTFVVAEAL